MAVTLQPEVPTPVRQRTRTCCADRSDDARALATVVASAAPAGPLLDIGCGSGAVALAVLMARPDISAVGVDVSASRCREAQRLAATMGLTSRFHALTGSAFDIRLPRSPAVVANPPMLPTEPGFSLPSRLGPPELFWMRLVAMISEWQHPVQLWLHLFDFQGVREAAGLFPTVLEVAADRGFDVAVAHHGWRAVAATSSLMKALPSLRRVFPDGLALCGDTPMRFADLPVAVRTPLSIPHSIVHLSRGLSLHGPRVPIHLATQLPGVLR